MALFYLGKNMSNLQIEQLSRQARHAASDYKWQIVGSLSEQILQIDANSAEGLFLKGLALKGIREFEGARKYFELALSIDESRYDAAIELSVFYSSMRRNADTFDLLEKYETALANSPRYLDSAATSYISIGMPEKAWPLYKKANELQPDIDLFQGNLASCAVYVGELDLARRTYRKLIDNNPDHRRNHHQYSRTFKATDRSHIEEMMALLEEKTVPEDRNMPLYFAIGKELEDLKQWDECFDYYNRGCEAVSEKIKYDPSEDIRLIDEIIKTCDADWFKGPKTSDVPGKRDKTPIFITGLPRTGTTLVERIVSNHSQVSSLGETMFLQMSLKTAAGVEKQIPLSAGNVREVASADLSNAPQLYLDALGYRIGQEPYFIEKLPLNFLYLGLIAKAWPDAKIVVLNRHPMDACFSMFKQVFTFVYKFSYSLEHLGQYYVAYHRLLNHWKELLGDRIIEVDYETLVDNQHNETKALLDELGLDFEQACIDFDKNTGPSTTASSVQVRSKINKSAVGKWRNFSKQLAPLEKYLRDHNISVD